MIGNRPRGRRGRRRIGGRTVLGPGEQPTWYDEDAEPCDHDSDHAETVDKQVGYSDSLFLKRRCTVCQATWCGWIEG